MLLTVFRIRTFLGADPDPGTGLLADMDPDLDPGDDSNGMDRARNSDQFTFLKFENPSTGSKVRSHQSWALFVQKSIFFYRAHLQK